MQYCEEHDLVIDPLHEGCPLCEAEEKSDEVAALRMENAQTYAMMECMGEELNRVKLTIARLRGIEKAALHGQTRADAAIRFRAMAREFVLYEDRAPLFALADALEAT